MFYKNLLKNKQYKYKLFNYATFKAGVNTDLDENIIPINQSKNSYNFNYDNGALTTGMGISPIEVHYSETSPELVKNLVAPEGVEFLGLWTYENYFSQLSTKDRLLVAYGNDKKMYFNYLHYDVNYFFEIPNCTQMSEMPQVINYYLNGQRAYLFITKSGGLQVYYNGLQQIKTIENAPAISSYCLHSNRMFVTDYNQPNKVWFSDESDPTNWQMGNDEAGYIELRDNRGYCLKVVSFDDYVYVFREFGITKLSSFKNQSSITVENMFLCNSRILADTICVCGDKVMFMTTDGLYSFNGNSTSKVELNINSWLDKVNSFSAAQFYNNCYYLSCKINFEDNETLGCEQFKHTNNALIKIDLLNKSVSVLRGVDITYLKTLNDVGFSFLCVVINENGVHRLGMITENGKIFDEKTKKFWRSSPYDFGMPNKKKLVKKFFINCNTDATIIFNYDGKSKQYDITASKGNIVISPNISAYKIGVEILTESENCNISSPQILVGYL